MARIIKTCRVCGKQYEACRTPNTSGIFRWRDVACSIECGRTYLERIEESRRLEADNTVMVVNEQSGSKDTLSSETTICANSEALHTEAATNTDIPKKKKVKKTVL